jgi:protoporphyrinogen oxidase
MKIGILGGGISGLVVAGECKSHECEVLEADDAIGGHCRSFTQEGYTFDLGGPHILFSKNKEILDWMQARLEGNLDQRRRANKIWFNGRFVKYPFENGLFDLAPEDRFECLFHYLKNEYPEPTNFREWIYHVFGKGIAEKYMLPYNEKIWNVAADQMSMDWVHGRVPRPPLEDVIKSAVGVETEGYTHQLYFGYPKSGGIEALPRAFAKNCKNITLNFRAKKVWQESGNWNVSDGKSTKTYDKLVSTIAIQDLVDALPDVPQIVQSSVHGLKYNSLVTVMLGAKADPIPYTALYVPDPDIVFHRLSFPLAFTDEGAPHGHVAIMAEITTNAGDGVHELSDEAITAKVIAALEKMQLVKPATVTFRKVYRTRHAYVVRTFDYSEKLKTGLDYVSGLGITSVGRNAEFEYINMDEAVRRALGTARTLDKEV